MSLQLLKVEEVSRQGAEAMAVNFLQLLGSWWFHWFHQPLESLEVEVVLSQVVVAMVVMLLWLEVSL